MQDKIKNEGFSPKLRQVIAEAHPRELRELATYINASLGLCYFNIESESIKEAIEAFGKGEEI